MDEEFYRRKLAVEDVDHGGQRQPGQMAGQLTVLSDEGFRGDEIKARVDSRAAAIILRDYLARCERLGEDS